MIARLLLAVALLAVALLALASFPVRAAEPDPWAGSRELMLKAVEVDVAFYGFAIGRDELSPRVMAALAAVPRHLFVPRGEEAWAYENREIPLAHGRSLARPYLPAVMAELLAVGPGDRVLEVGTGAGFQAALLSPLAKQVYTVEPEAELAAEAAERLARLGYGNVAVAHGDGRAGWPEHAPFDAILVTLAVRELPLSLLDQLRPGGNLLVPLVDPKTGLQALTLVHKNEKGKLRPRPRALLQTGFELLP